MTLKLVTAPPPPKPDVPEKPKRKGKPLAPITFLHELERPEQEAFIRTAHDAIVNLCLPVVIHKAADGSVYESPMNKYVGWTVEQALKAYPSQDKREKDEIEYLLKEIGVRFVPRFGTMMDDIVEATGVKYMTLAEAAAKDPGEWTIDNVETKYEQAARFRAADGESSRPLAYVFWPGKHVTDRVKKLLKPLEDYADVYNDLPLYSATFAGELVKDFGRIIRRYRPSWADRRLDIREKLQTKPYDPAGMSEQELHAVRIRANHVVLNALTAVGSRQTISELIQEAMSDDREVRNLARRVLTVIGIHQADAEDGCTAKIVKPSWLYEKTGDQLRLYKKVIGEDHRPWQECFELHLPRVERLAAEVED